MTGTSRTSPNPNRRVLKSIFSTAFLAVALASPVFGFSPVLDLINPRGGQRGTEMEISLTGDRLENLEEALFYEPGLTVSHIVVKDPKNATAKLTIAPDASLGEHSVRFRSTGGVTEIRSFFVGPFPTVFEVEPNQTLAQPQRVELDQTVQGVASNEDEDFFVVTLKKGQRLSVEVEAMRLGRVLFDAYVAIFDPQDVELAACDDAPLLKTDAFVSIIAPEDGDYRVLVREAAYEGSSACQYRLHIGTFPRPSSVFPLGGRPGETVEFTFHGDPSGPIKKTITLPAEPNPHFPIFPEQDGQSAPSPHFISVSPLESITESGANLDGKSATAMPPIPSAAHGILDGEQKADWFKFFAKKDENLIIKVVARALRSPLDSVLTLHHEKGNPVAKNDDLRGPDSVIPWSCPADGEYFLKIEDQLRRTGPDLSYRIEIVHRTPAIAANLPTVETRDSQKWKTFPVPRGNRYAAVVNLTRENIACDAIFEAASLPVGMTMTVRPPTKALTSFPVVFEAAADAPIAGGLHAFSIHSTGVEPTVTGSLIDTVHYIDITNEGTYHSVISDRVSTAVTTEAPFKIDLETPPVPLVQDGVLQLKVAATRSAGFAEPLTLRFLWNPPGVSAPATIDLPGDQNEIFYELNTNAEAAIGDWPICVLAEANTPLGPVVVSSALVTLKVAEPYLTLTLEMAATEQGKASSMFGKIQKTRDLPGDFSVEVVGLPHGVTAPVLNFNKDATEISIPLTVAADASVGKHASVFCKVIVKEPGGPIVHQTAKGSTLRIDAAPAAKSTSEKPVPSPAPPVGAKPLSRLEQLRQRAK
jgi:hypothetical protein